MPSVRSAAMRTSSRHRRSAIGGRKSWPRAGKKARGVMPSRPWWEPGHDAADKIVAGIDPCGFRGISRGDLVQCRAASGRAADRAGRDVQKRLATFAGTHVLRMMATKSVPCWQETRSEE